MTSKNDGDPVETVALGARSGERGAGDRSDGALIRVDGDAGAPADAADRLADAFWQLGEETRLRIVVALWRRQEEAPLSYAALKRAVDVRDNGRFNYHLRQLLGTFVTKADEGYRPSAAAAAACRGVVAGLPAGDDRWGVALDAACPDCRAELFGVYDAGRFAVRCPDGDRTVVAAPMPPAGVAARDDRTILRAFDRCVRADVSAAREGVCLDCGGVASLSWALADVPDSRDRAPSSAGVRVHSTCDRCGPRGTVGAGAVLLAEPAVVSLAHERGVDLGTTPLWKLRCCASAAATELRSRSPTRIAAELRFDGDPFEALLDGDLALVGLRWDGDR
jgi:hypothetical protein